MKIDIDCTPEEARSFFGLPDVAPLQAALMAEAEARMREAFAKLTPEAMVKLWFPAGLEGWEQMQKQFWSQFGAGTGARRKAK